MRFLLAAACLLLAGRALAEPVWLSALPEALTASASQGKPILLDFSAPWCYSCYYMEKNVLTHDPFFRKAAKLVLLKVDVDQPEGLKLKEKYRVTFLPTYVLLDSKGKALSRIIGEQTEKDFLDKLDSSLASTAKDPDAAAVESLRARLSANEYPEAASFISSLPKEAAARLDGRADWSILTARLALMRAVKAAPAQMEAGLSSLRTLLASEQGCGLAYDVDYAEKLRQSASADEKHRVREAERGPLEKLVNEKIFAGACADFRSGVEDLAGVYEDLGLSKERGELLDRAAVFLEKKNADVGEDRNRDDNLRFFLELKKDDDALSRLYPRLIAAYASDYVYPYRFAKYLAGKKDFAAALPFIEKADTLCYGANRLRVTGVRAQILAGLDRRSEALSLLKRDIKVYKKSFPQDTDNLSSLLKDLSR